MPDLAGLTIEEALDIIGDFELETGVRITLTQQKVGTTNQDLVGKIVETNPPAGTSLEGAAQVVAFVGELQQPTTTTIAP
jgi:beta-lactam-binding protein with PASTA domain